MESVFRHCRSTEPSARHRQMDTTQTTLLSLETMGTSRLPGTAQARCKRARSLEHQQIGARPLAVEQHPGTEAGITSAALHELGAAGHCGAAGIYSSNRRVRDPYARWCGRRGAVRRLPIPIRLQEISMHPPIVEWLFDNFFAVWFFVLFLIVAFWVVRILMVSSLPSI